MVSVFQIGHSIENNTKSRVSSLEVQDRHKLLHSTNRASSRILPRTRPAFWLSSPARPFNPKQLARSRLGQAGSIVLFRSNFRFFRVEDRPRVEQKNSIPIGHNSSLGKAAQAKYTPNVAGRFSPNSEVETADSAAVTSYPRHLG